MADPKTKSPTLLNHAQVCAKLGGQQPIDNSTLWRRINRDPDFPRPFYLWDGAPRFIESEVDSYILKKIAERDDPACVAAQRERRERVEEKAGPARAKALEEKQRRQAKPRREGR